MKLFLANGTGGMGYGIWVAMVVYGLWVDRSTGEGNIKYDVAK